MHKNHRTLLATVGILAAGGASSPSLSNIDSLDLTSLIGGGSKYELSNSPELNTTPKRLILDQKNLSEMNVKPSEFKNLSLPPNLKDESLITHKIDTKKSSEHTKGIIQEIDRESKSLTINKNSAAEVTFARSKVSSSLKTYKSALQKIQNYQTMTSSGKKRSIQIQHFPELTLQERKSLYDFYRKFKELQSKAKNFSTELKKIDTEHPVITANLEGECKTCANIDQALQKIGWFTQPALNIFTKRDQKWNNRSPVPKKDSWKTLWGDWDKKENPYSHFWISSSQETSTSSAKSQWIDAVNKIYQNRKKYHDTVNSSSWRACGLTIGLFGANCGYGKKGSMEQSIKDSHSEIELQIGSKLLEWMQQLGNKL